MNTIAVYHQFISTESMERSTAEFLDDFPSKSKYLFYPDISAIEQNEKRRLIYRRALLFFDSNLCLTLTRCFR